MLAYVLDAAEAATGGRPLVVVSPVAEEVRAAFAERADFAVQAEPRGTADAVRAALDALPESAPEIVLLSGDVPLVDPSLLVELAALRRDRGAAMALVSVTMDEPGSLGRIMRDPDRRVERVVEARDASPDELVSHEVNAGLYAFEGGWLRARIEAVRPSPVTGEFYLPELVALARAEDRTVVALDVNDDGTLLGINDRAQLADAELAMRRRINAAHLRAGVTIRDPASTFIDADVEIGEDVTIEPGVSLRGRTIVGRDALIRSGSQIVNTRIGERTVVWASILEDSVVEADVTIGPYSHVRKGAHIGSGVELGNYAEVKNSSLGRGTKSHHFSYLGDADVGEGVNIGAGTITANFDGLRKHRTHIGDRAFIGSDTILRAPVSVGKDALTGAASLVTRDVPDGKMALGLPARIRERRPRPDGAAGDPAVEGPAAGDRAAAGSAAGAGPDEGPISAEGDGLPAHVEVVPKR
jgi:bifunctional UDP-N-acetylglucosamine pyrophosphorylase/glucosamine-1-phosphate N-acetyltransferase